MQPKTGVVRQNQWSNNREKLQTEMETMGNRQDEDTKSLLEQVQVENRSRYDYRRFLQKFSVLREEMLVDEDSFDYVFYTYGLFPVRKHAAGRAVGIKGGQPD